MLLSACCIDLRFDRQCEGPRGHWLCSLIEAADAEDCFRKVLLDRLRTSSAERMDQLCEIAYHYAKRGDAAFREALYRIVQEKPHPTYPWLGEDELIALDGEEGFLAVTRVRGAMSSREWDYEHNMLIDAAAKCIGADRVHEILESPENSVRSFRDRWRVQQEEWKSRTNPSRAQRAEESRRIPVEQIFAAAETQDQCHFFRSWGMHAGCEELELVLRRLLDTRDPKVLVKYLRVFSRREFPRIDERLLTLCAHEDPEVRNWSHRALANNSFESIRQLAVESVERGCYTKAVIGLFIRNYRAGDEDWILRPEHLPDDRESVHSILFSLHDMLTENPSAKRDKLPLDIYGLTPCPLCRNDAASMLCDAGAAPTWLREECRYDVDEDTREIFLPPEVT